MTTRPVPSRSRLYMVDWSGEQSTHDWTAARRTRRMDPGPNWAGSCDIRRELSTGPQSHPRFTITQTGHTTTHTVIGPQTQGYIITYTQSHPQLTIIQTRHMTIHTIIGPPSVMGPPTQGYRITHSHIHGSPSHRLDTRPHTLS